MNAVRIDRELGSSPSAEDVVDVAAGLLADGGPAAVSVRRVATRLGVSRQIVYSRFGDKGGLIRAMHDEGFRRLSERVGAVRSPLGSDERLVELAAAYRAAAVAEPELFAVMFERPIPEFAPDDEARAVAATAFEPIVAAAEAWLRPRGHAADRAAALRLARMCWSTTHGRVSLELSGHGPPDPESALEASISVMLAGVNQLGGAGSDQVA